MRCAHFLLGGFNYEVQQSTSSKTAVHLVRINALLVHRFFLTLQDAQHALTRTSGMAEIGIEHFKQSLILIFAGREAIIYSLARLDSSLAPYCYSLVGQGLGCLAQKLRTRSSGINRLDSPYFGRKGLKNAHLMEF